MILNWFNGSFRPFGTFFISWGWLRTVVGKEKGKTEFKEYDGQRIASKSKFHHFSFAFLSFSLQRTTHKQESEKLRMGATKSQKTLWAPDPHLQFPIRAIISNPGNNCAMQGQGETKHCQPSSLQLVFEFLRNWFLPPGYDFYPGSKFAE